MHFTLGKESSLQTGGDYQQHYVYAMVWGFKHAFVK